MGRTRSKRRGKYVGNSFSDIYKRWGRGNKRRYGIKNDEDERLRDHIVERAKEILICDWRNRGMTTGEKLRNKRKKEMLKAWRAGMMETVRILLKNG